MKKYISNIKFFLLKRKNKEIIRFLKVHTPIFVKNIGKTIIFKKEIVEAKYTYKLLNNWKAHNFVDSEDLIEKFQEKKLQYILNYAYKFSPYYERLFNENNINIENVEDFYKIPLLEKETIRKNKNRLLSKNIYKIKFANLNTGGSTGEPLAFPVSYLTGHIDYIHQQFVFEAMGYKKGNKIFAFEGSTVPNYLINKKIYWVKKTNEEIPYGSLSYSSLYLNKDTIKYYIKHLLASKPSILRGFPSFINEIALYIIEKNIKIDFFIKGIQLTAENIFDWQIDNIKKAFETNVFFQYGHTEQCVFGFTKDTTYEYFCSPFYGLIEILNSNGKKIKKGEMGEIVATSFYNTALPFIRYKTGDWAIFNGSEDGFVKLKKIEGRTQDFIYKKDGGKISITGIVFGQHYQEFKNIKKLQIHQNRLGEIIIKIIKGEKFSKDNEQEIMNKFKNIADIDVHFDFVDNIELTKRGKFRFVVVDKALSETFL